MTLIELTVLLLYLAILVTITLLALGLPDEGSLRAVFDLCIAYFVLFAAFVAFVAACFYYDSWRTGRPHIPPCEQCGATEFAWDPQLRAGVRACPCGRRYVRRGLQCLEVLPGGVTIPYRRWRPFRRWIDDRTPLDTPVPAPYR